MVINQLINFDIRFVAFVQTLKTTAKIYFDSFCSRTIFLIDLLIYYSVILCLSIELTTTIKS